MENCHIEKLRAKSCVYRSPLTWDGEESSGCHSSDLPQREVSFPLDINHLALSVKADLNSSTKKPA